MKILDKFLNAGADVISTCQYKTVDPIAGPMTIKSHVIRPAGLFATGIVLLTWYAAYKGVKYLTKKDED